MRLAGDDLPIAVPPQPGIGYMITGAQVLAKDRLRLVSIVTKDGHVIVNPTLHLFDFDRTGIPRWHRRDIPTSFLLSMVRPFSSANMQSSAKSFFQGA